MRKQNAKLATVTHRMPKIRTLLLALLSLTLSFGCHGQLGCESPPPLFDIDAIVPRDSSVTLSTGKLPAGSSEGQYRVRHAQALQFERWSWVQTFTPEYVGLLQKAGISYESIEAMALRRYPLGFASEEQFASYREDLRQTLDRVTERSGLKEFRVIQQGSYVTGYSSNPLKGDRSIPNHIFNSESDLDLRISASGLAEHVKTNNISFETRELYPNLVKPDQLMKILPELDQFRKLWEERLGRRLQITIDLYPTEQFEPKPWDWELSLCRV